MSTIRVNFIDFWPHWNPSDNYFYHLLSTKYQVALDSNHPDIAFCSIFGNSHQQINRRRTRKIMFTGESRSFDSSAYDTTLSFGRSAGNNVQFPLWVVYIDWFNRPTMNSNPGYFVNIDIMRSKNFPNKSKFCNFIYNNNSGLRTKFFESLNTIKNVDSFGRLMNNMGILGGSEQPKIEAMINYKFSICFENIKQDYYITEKIIHGFAAHSIPIYWGSDKVFEFFNKDAFIYVNDEHDIGNVVNKIISLDKDVNEYRKVYEQPVFVDNVLDNFTPSEVLRKLGL